MTADSAAFFDAIIRQCTGASVGDQIPAPGKTRILDLGCGDGALVRELAAMGYATSGCDVVCSWSATEPRLSLIADGPYRLPYPDEEFDFIVSTSVVEHVRNKEAMFREMHRVLKQGGIGLHLYPSKWYLPCEPHVLVPLMNYFWPRCPKWYLALWAWVGIRNRFQKGVSWGEVVRLNKAYEQTGVSYWSNRRIKRIVTSIFGNCDFPVRTYIRFAGGGAASVFGTLFGAYLDGLICNTFRMSFLVFRKGNS